MIMSRISRDLSNWRSTFNAEPPLTNDNPHTLTVTYVFSFQNGIVSACGLSFIGVGPDST